MISAAILVSAIMLAAGVARAGCPEAAPAPVTRDPVEADRLFTEAKQLQKNGRLAKSCDTFARSLALDPAGGALLRLAYCLELEGKAASSHARFQEALEMARREGNESRADLAQEHLAALEPRLRRIQIRVSPAARALSGLEIRRNGQCVDPAQGEKAIPVDPGRHRISATAPKVESWEIVVEPAPDGATIVVEVPALVPSAAPPAGQEAVTPRASRGSPLPGVAVAGLGGGGLAIGAVTGGMALAAARELKSTCDKGRCPPSQRAEGDRARTLGAVAAVGLSVGGALAAAGVALWVVRPFGRGRAAATLSVGPSSLWMVGRF
jgi:hypothetical protein